MQQTPVQQEQMPKTCLENTQPRQRDQKSKNTNWTLPTRTLGEAQVLTKKEQEAGSTCHAGFETQLGSCAQT